MFGVTPDDGPLVLGIETSCDETGVGIVRGTTLLADAVASSSTSTRGSAGWCPRSRRGRTSRRWCRCWSGPAETAGVRLDDVDAIAVTSGPGLAGALLVGVAAAKALAIGLGKPLYGVNHLAAHVAVDQLEHGPLPEPCLALLVSGGHSSLLEVSDVTVGVEPLGATIDDAAGEAFDKVARLLGLPFPGGPHIDRMAASGEVTIDFPRGLTSRRDLERHRFDFSFSGLKTAVARWVEARQASGEPVPVADVAASFQEAVCDVLVRKALDAAADRGIEDLLIGGGVAANSRLRAMAVERAAARGVRVRVPRPGLCTDNGAMVAALGAELVARGRTPSALDLPADSSMPITTVRGLTAPLVKEVGDLRPLRVCMPWEVAGRPLALMKRSTAVSGSRSARARCPGCPAAARSRTPSRPSTSIRTIDHWPSWKGVNSTWSRPPRRPGRRRRRPSRRPCGWPAARPVRASRIAIVPARMPSWNGSLAST